MVATKLKRVTINLDPDVYDRLAAIAADQNSSIAGLIVRIVANTLDPGAVKEDRTRSGHGGKRSGAGRKKAANN